MSVSSQAEPISEGCKRNQWLVLIGRQHQSGFMLMTAMPEVIGGRNRSNGMNEAIKRSNRTNNKEGVKGRSMKGVGNHRRMLRLGYRCYRPGTTTLSKIYHRRV